MSLLTEFANGLTLDFTSKAWGGNGIYRGVPSKTNRIKIRVPKKPVEPIHLPIKPKIVELTQSQKFVQMGEVKTGRTIEEHRSQVELYARMYANGFDPLTGKDLKEVESLEYFQEVDGELILRNVPITQDEFKPSQKDFSPPAWSASRNINRSENEATELLRKIFMDKYDENEDTSEDF